MGIIEQFDDDDDHHHDVIHIEDVHHRNDETDRKMGMRAISQ